MTIIESGTRSLITYIGVKRVDILSQTPTHTTPVLHEYRVTDWVTFIGLIDNIYTREVNSLNNNF